MANKMINKAAESKLAKKHVLEMIDVRNKQIPNLAPTK